jgi:hypothetical protein
MNFEEFIVVMLRIMQKISKEMYYVLSKKEDHVYIKRLKAKIETKMQYINFYVTTTNKANCGRCIC